MAPGESGYHLPLNILNFEVQEFKSLWRSWTAGDNLRKLDPLPTSCRHTHRETGIEGQRQTYRNIEGRDTDIPTLQCQCHIRLEAEDLQAAEEQGTQETLSFMERVQVGQGWTTGPTKRLQQRDHLPEPCLEVTK